MTIIEWMAAIIAVGLIVKLVVVMISPKAWLKVVMPLYSNSLVMTLVGLILAGGSLYFLVSPNYGDLTIVQIFAVMFFMSSLIIVGVAGYAKEIIALGKKLMQKGLMKRMWLYILIWLVLAIWALKELFL